MDTIYCPIEDNQPTNQSILECPPKKDAIQKMMGDCKKRNRKYKSDLDMEITSSIQNEIVSEAPIKQQDIKEENQTENWNPVNYIPVDPKVSQNSKKLKFQYHQNSLYPTKIIKRKNKFKNIDLQNNQQAKKYLKHLAKEYHKNLLEEVLENQRIKQEEGIKDQDQVIHMNKNLNRFPIYSHEMREKNYSSIQELKDFLRNQQEEILSKINDPQISSVFVNSFEEIIKPSNSTKEYHNFKCKITNCQAILKCAVTLDNCQLYTFRNRHNHTITGQIIEAQVIKTPETVTIDEGLHEMFGFSKGVRSQTRNIKYIDPEDRKVYKKKEKHHDVDQQKVEKQERVRKPIKKKKFKRKGKKDFKKIEDTEFTNMAQQLEHQNYKVYASSFQDCESPFAQLTLLTKNEMIESIPNPSVVRMTLYDMAIRLDKKKYPINNVWSLALVTSLNPSLKAIVLAIIIAPNPISAYITKIVSLIVKICPSAKYLVSQYNNDIIKSIADTPLTLLFDSVDILNAIGKDLKDQELEEIVKQLIDPSCNCRSQIIQLLRLKKENVVVSFYQQMKKYLIVEDLDKEYLEFDHNLIQERDIVRSIRVRLKNNQNRHPLKLQLNNAIETVLLHNKKAKESPLIENPLQLEKIHRDNGLKLVRQSTTSAILNQFYLQYGRSLDLKPIKQQKKYQFKNSKEIVDNWVCTCPFRKVTGVPCEHLIAVLHRQRKNYLFLFHRKWITNVDNLVEQSVDPFEDLFDQLNNERDKQQAQNQGKKKKQAEKSLKKSKGQLKNGDDSESKRKTRSEQTNGQ